MRNKKRYFLLCLFAIYSFSYRAQITNYITNGGFERCGNCPNLIGPFKRPQGWNAIDSNQAFADFFSRTLLNNVPLNSFTYQWPRHGDNFIGTTPYCSTCSYNTRGYPRNTLKSNLQAGRTYCFSMYVNLTNKSSYAISNLGAYFADSSTDTITQCTLPLSFLTPQIQNPSTNFLTDTLHWTLIRGLYTANGNEKYLLIGNFNNDANTDTLFVNPEILPQRGCSYLFDDISCIDIDLPAFAGNDAAVIPGDSVFLGRESDVGIDEDCFWYKLPTVITPTTPALDTIAGFWVKPVANCTYVVKQDICGNVKWDTVTIVMNPLGIKSLVGSGLHAELKIYPIPAKDKVELRLTNGNLFSEFNSLSIYTSLGQKIREEVLRQAQQTDGTLTIKTDELANGAYFIILSNARNERVTKKLLIAK